MRKDEKLFLKIVAYKPDDITVRHIIAKHFSFM